MSNTVKKRPDLARKVTRKTVEKQDAEMSAGLRVELSKDEVYEIRMGDVTPQAARELRRVCGFGFVTLCNLMGSDPDIDLISTFVWFARRLAGEDALEIDDVSVGYDVLTGEGFDVAAAGDEVITPGPEA